METRPPEPRATFQPPFVRADTGRLRAALLVKPSPALASQRPQQGESNAIAERAAEQHALLAARLAAAGVSLVTLGSEPDAPLGSLCADTAIFFADGAFLMRPSDLRRRREVAAVEAALLRAGIPIVGRIEAPGILDGGDVLLAPDVLYLGLPNPGSSQTGIPVGLHGNAHGREQLAAYARERGRRVVEVALWTEVCRLRSVASLIAPDTVLLAPGVIDAAAFAGMQLLEVPRGEDFGAGVVVLGERRVIANLRFRQTLPLLRKAKIAVEALDLWEFGKIGATPSLLVLALKRD
jgi:dimethylargininase